VPQNDEKECGVWLNEEERTKVVVKVEVPGCVEGRKVER
jgi:hypothetical protein